jgi:hypothetical protein
MSEFTRRRSWTEIVLFTLGALLIGHSLFVNLTRTDPQEFHFELTIDKAGLSFQTKAEGGRKLYGKQFYFEGDRVTFLGEIDGERVTITGTVRSGDEKQTRDFKVEGTILDKRMVSSVMSDKGSKIGKIELLF